MSDRGHFLNIDTLNRILFSQLTRFGKLSFFNFRPSFLSPDTFRSIGCKGCKLIFLADAVQEMTCILLIWPKQNRSSNNYKQWK